jgi:hypothetical protein
VLLVILERLTQAAVLVVDKLSAVEQAVRE